ncbi:hypothetical protein P167DRAFT_607596 [Morchella conica CCBAS932]|uniref:Uncharacterized protein n=1 Tax=Morchella conica CCBAS932 TaxID=1392247 RepID=A0A3N4KVU7_9PEZI|nr:hypothetical protein P167DRAFT_607596 [Morchella conica CCBAS932]
MVIRNKDPCQPCRQKKIRCNHNIQQTPSPAPVVSPKASLTPRKTRQAMEKPSTISLGNIPVFESQEGLDALATISNNNLGARDNTPDLLETCNTKPVVKPRKRGLFRESPPAKLTKKQRVDSSPTDTFEAEMNVSVPAWMTEKLKSIPDFRGPMGSKRSGLRNCRKNLKTFFANTRDSEDSSNGSVQSASTGEPEKEERLRIAKASLDTNASRSGSSRATTSIVVIDDDDNPFPSISEDFEHNERVKGGIGALSLMSPPAPALIETTLENPEAGNPVEAERHSSLSVQALEEEPEKSMKPGNAGLGMLQEVESKLPESEPSVPGSLSSGKNLEKQVNGPVEIEPHQQETTDDVENAPYGCKPLSTKELVPMINGAVDGKLTSEGNDSEVPVVTGLGEQGIEHRGEEQCVASNPDDPSSGEPGLQSIVTSDGSIDDKVNVEHIPHLGSAGDSPLDKAGVSEKNVFKDTVQKDLVEVKRGESTQATLKDVQQSPDESSDPEANILYPDIVFPRYQLPIAPIHPNGIVQSSGLNPWNRASRDESLVSSEGSMDSDDARRTLWSKEQAESPSLSTIDRSRWRDLDAGPSRFSGPRIVTPLRATPLEPGMGLVDTKRYSQHEGLWNMVTNDYLAKFKRVSKDKEEERL